MQKAPAPAVATIPTPMASVDSLHASVTALKQVVEQMMMGDLTGKNKGAEYKPSMFVQGNQPVDFHDGDFWLSTGGSTVLSVAIGGGWRRVGDLV